MRIKEIYLLLLSTMVFMAFAGFSDFSLSESFIFGFILFSFLRLLNNVGSYICFFDFLMFVSVLTTLAVPIIGYRFYNAQNHLAVLWKAYMRVPQEEYFGFMIPANLALFFGINLFLNKANHREIPIRLKAYMKDKGYIGVVLTLIGFGTSFIQPLLPVALSYFFYLLTMLRYVGPLYIYFSEWKFKTTALIAAGVLFFSQAIIQGMFGEFFMYFILTIILLSLKFRFRFFSKLVVTIFALVLVGVLQSIKVNYRAVTWSGRTVDGISLNNSSRYQVFGSLFFGRMQNLNSFTEERLMFNMYTRFNQGGLIAGTMNYVPNIEPFANGTTLARSAGAILVPRFLWPNKPEAGGRENLSRFLGVKHKVKFSMNIGPFGEAYGNFGPVWGVIFMFLYGTILALLLNHVINRSKTTPSFILWLPLFFYYTLTVETDIMTTLNSLFKAYLLAILCYWVARRFFNVSL